MKPLPIGTRVRYTHIACSMKRQIEQTWVPCPSGCDDGVKDLRKCWACNGSGEVLGKKNYLGYGKVDPRDKRFAKIVRDVPIKEWLGSQKEMDRWVEHLPLEGEGFIVGLTYRQEGFWDTFTIGGYYLSDDPPEYQNYLTLVKNHALYEVKNTLRSKSFLVPVESVQVL